jgi:phage I-like protein
MREAERQRDSATEYAQALETQRQSDQKKFLKIDTDYWKRFETNIKTGMESAQNELTRAIEAGDAKAQVEANKRIATLAFDNAKLEQAKENKEDVKLSDGGKLPTRTPQTLPEQPADPQAETWAGKNKWFGQNRAMTFTAFEIHKDLVEKEGYDPKSNEYYTEIDKRIRVDFPNKFDKDRGIETSKPVQSVASAQRSVKQGRQTVRLTSSQVAIAKKLGVPLEEYAKQLKLTKEA